MNQKLCIFLLGAGASGKSTTTKAFANGNPVQYQEMIDANTMKGIRPMKTTWTVYNNCALAGNHNSGSDANNGPGVIRSAWLKCMDASNIVIVDGMMISPQWAQMVQNWAGDHKNVQLGILLVHFDLTAEQVLERLSSRRGVDKESIRSKMMEKCIRNVARPIDGFRYFDDHCSSIPTTTLKIYVEDSTAEIVKLMQNEVDEYFIGNW